MKALVRDEQLDSFNKKKTYTFDMFRKPIIEDDDNCRSITNFVTKFKLKIGGHLI